MNLKELESLDSLIELEYSISGDQRNDASEFMNKLQQALEYDQKPEKRKIPDDQLNPEWQMQKTTIQKALESLFAGNTKFHPQETGTYFSSIHPILSEHAVNLQANKKEKST